MSGPEPLVRIVRSEGEAFVPCLPTPVPGIVLANVDGSVTVTHQRSGLQFAWFDDSEQAARFVLHEVPGLGVDWTASAAEIRGAIPDDFYIRLTDAIVRCDGDWGGVDVDRDHPSFVR